MVLLGLIFLWTGMVTTKAEGTQTSSETTSTETPQEKKSELRIIHVIN
ncbi:hypothetical protein BGP_0042 [Beggiatoa sp. PS]|nr:hypothetical protein BGP_0042 [Beggiatoa sp. PS]